MATWALDDRQQLNKDANKALDENLGPSEAVRVILRGPSNQALIATDSRVFIFKKGFMAGSMFGQKLASFDLRQITGVTLEFGMLTGFVALQGPGIQAGDASYWGKGKDDPWKMPHALPVNDKGHANEAVAALRQLIAAAQQQGAPSQAPAAIDVMGQLRQLGELRDAGVLTEQEFESKKAELLGRL